ncbi:MAG TPA: ABC transporter permease [Pedobacter sp.]|uniref:ABC transporter permease n=1 Tax=Pedobacter sp. TaxID=1411316 RepID=UPI002BF4B506|nr:ABC transporter permease [Pedobacter sp.]HMI03438.1 ABC transporter permease [Pedobacter sp.]
MFKLNFKIAVRNLWKNKGFTLINVGGLAIGLASCMVLLLYVAYEWGYDRQFTNYEKTYVVYNNQKASNSYFTHAWTPGIMATEIKEKIPGVKYTSHSTYPYNMLITYKNNGYKKQAVHADPSFLKILDYKFLKGDPNTVLRNINSVVLTESFAKTLFGNEDPINKELKLDNKEPLRVEGIIADVPENSSIQFDCLMSWSLYEKTNPWVKESGWNNSFCLNIVQLKDNNYFGQANSQVKNIIKSNNPESGTEIFLHPISKWHLYDNFENGKCVGGRIDQVKIFALLACCILLIACINFMNLSTARSEKRAREVGVRKAIGSSRKSLIGQFMLESVLLSLIGMAVAFVLIEISLPYFNNLLNIELIIEYQGWKFWTMLLMLTLFAGLIAGSYPAFHLSSFEPVKVLKGFSLKSGSSSLSIRKILVVFQFAFAACLIVCTSVIYQQLNFIKSKPIGYNKGNLVQLTAHGNLKDLKKLQLLKEQLIKSGAVTNMSNFTLDISSGGNNTTGITWPGKNPKEDILFNTRGTGYDFVETIGTEMVAGREFSPQYTDSTNVIVNQAAVKAMRLKNPVGTVIELRGHRVIIIGVMKDFVVESAYKEVAPMLFYSDHLDEVAVILARLNPSQNISSSVAKIDEIVKQLNPGYPVERTFVDDVFEFKFQNEKLLGTLSNWFGGFAVFISCLGLLGLALYMAEQRKKEISIRKVLGASTANILTLLNKDFVKLVAIANLIAFPIAYIVINKWLSAYEFRISISVLPFAIAIGLSFLIAILTVSIQSVKVAKSNPVDALKYE